MATVPYLLYRNESAGKPSVYCRVQHHQTLKFDDLCKHAATGLGFVNKGTVRAIVQTVLDEAYSYTAMGWRVEIGDRFLSLYPQVKKSVKATIDKETGEVIWPNDEDVVPRNKDGRIECEVHKRLNKTFRREVHWERAKHDYRKFRKKKKPHRGTGTV